MGKITTAVHCSHGAERPECLRHPIIALSLTSSLGKGFPGSKTRGAESVEAGFQEDPTLDWTGRLYSIFSFFAGYKC